MKYLFYLIVFVPLCIFSQQRVGVNVSEVPKTTFELARTQGTDTRAEGFTMPKLTTTELKGKDVLYTTLQNGAMVYVTEVLPNSQRSEKTKYIEMPGCYYYDAPNEVWIMMKALNSEMPERKFYSNKKVYRQTSADANQVLDIGRYKFFMVQEDKPYVKVSYDLMGEQSASFTLGFKQMWPSTVNRGYEFFLRKQTFTSSESDSYVAGGDYIGRKYSGMGSDEFNIAYVIIKDKQANKQYFYRVNIARFQLSITDYEYMMSAERF